jgi:hypothetical protein
VKDYNHLIARLESADTRINMASDQAAMCLAAAAALREQQERIEELEDKRKRAMELADELLEDLELHGLHDDSSWKYRRQKAQYVALAYESRIKALDAERAAKRGKKR